MADSETRKRGLLDRWSRLEQARMRTPCASELVSIIAEQIRVQDELHDFGTDVRPAGAAPR